MKCGIKCVRSGSLQHQFSVDRCHFDERELYKISIFFTGFLVMQLHVCAWFISKYLYMVQLSKNWQYAVWICPQHPDRSIIQLSKKDAKFRGYYLIARHYRWALNQVFHQFNYSAAIIVEGETSWCIHRCRIHRAPVGKNTPVPAAQLGQKCHFVCTSFHQLHMLSGIKCLSIHNNLK